MFYSFNSYVVLVKEQWLTLKTMQTSFTLKTKFYWFKKFILKCVEFKPKQLIWGQLSFSHQKLKTCFPRLNTSSTLWLIPRARRISHCFYSSCKTEIFRMRSRYTMLSQCTWARPVPHFLLSPMYKTLYKRYVSERLVDIHRLFISPSRLWQGWSHYCLR